MSDITPITKLSGTLLYVQIQKPVKAYQAEGTDKKPDEWKASVAIADEDFIDSFEEYAKDIDAKISIKKVKTAQFEEIYKCEPPEDAGKNVWVLTFRKSTELGKTGKPVPDNFKPKVYEKIGKTLLDITNDKLPTNGSEGIVSLEVFTRKNGTSSIYLKNVLVTKLIEYVKPEGTEEYYNPGDEFADEDVETVEVGKKGPDGVVPSAEKPAAKAKVSPKKAKEVQEELEDEDVPF